MPNATWYSHDMKSVRSIMTTCIGYKYGESPEERLEEIREGRYQYGKRICKRLNVNENDTVLDIGSGCGFVSRAASEIAKQVHCLDISKDFLDFTRVELAKYNNTYFHQIEYGRFIGIPDNHATKVFSTAVFIHFNYYDILFYLIEINRVLQTDGNFYLEIIDADALSLNTMAGIKTNIKNYTNDERGDAQLMHPHSLTAFKHLAQQLGFVAEHIDHTADVANILLKKISQPNLPEWFDEVNQYHSSATTSS